MEGRLAILIGTLNRKLPLFEGASCSGPGLASGWFDPEAITLTIADEERYIDNSAFLRMHPTLPVVYCTSEVHDWQEGVISSVAVSPDDLRLTYLNKQAALGSCTAHCSVDRTGKFLLVTNFMIGNKPVLPGMGVVTFPIRDDGSLCPPASSIRFSGRGPDDVRQGRSHPHCIFATADNRHVIVADLGIDALLTIPFDQATGQLDEHDTKSCEVPSGSGPRHFVFHPNGQHVYLLNEISGTLNWFDLSSNGALSLSGTVSARAKNAAGRNDSSDLQITSDGRFLYAANRGDDSVALFAVLADGSLDPAGHVSAEGRCPRNLAISPGNRLLLVSNQYSDSISVFSIGQSTGELKFLKSIEIGSPMAIIFPSIT